MGGIEAAAIYGSFASGGPVTPASDVDVLVIGEPDRDRLMAAAREVEQLVGREISVAVYDPVDWAERVARGAGFATTVLDRPLVHLIGAIPGAGS